MDLSKVFLKVVSLKSRSRWREADSLGAPLTIDTIELKDLLLTVKLWLQLLGWRNLTLENMRLRMMNSYRRGWEKEHGILIALMVTRLKDSWSRLVDHNWLLDLVLLLTVLMLLLLITSND